jgi:hypothetical protein
LRKPYFTAPSICSRSEHDQAEGRDQQHLEPDIEIEDIAGQKGAGDAGHQQHQERIEAVAPTAVVDVGERIDAAGKRHDGGRQSKERAGQVDGEGDAERRQPAPHDHRYRSACKDMAK